MKQEWGLRIVAALVGVVFGWLANDLLGTRYFLAVTTRPSVELLIDTKTGETWILHADRGEPLSWQTLGEPQR